MRENGLLTAWRDGRQAIGCWLGMANAYSAESLGQLGFDYLCMDLQHGLLDYQDLVTMLPAASTGSSTPLVRVPWNEPYEIMKALDVGAYGVIVPMVNDRAQAQQAVAACRYPPEGNRSWGPIRAAVYAGSGYAEEANRTLACIAMIETLEGLKNLEEILTTPGLDAIYIGPADLALALGLPALGDTDHPTHADAIEQILQACKKHGVPAGIHTSSLEYCQRRLAAGFDFATLGSDSGFMIRTAARELAAARGTTESTRENTGY